MFQQVLRTARSAPATTISSSPGPRAGTTRRACCCESRDIAGNESSLDRKGIPIPRRSSGKLVQDLRPLEGDGVYDELKMVSYNDPEDFQSSSTLLSQFAGVTAAPPDPILTVYDAYQADDSPSKLNLGMGMYRTDELQPKVMNCVRKAESTLLLKMLDKDYLPVAGTAAFLQTTVSVLLGRNHPAVQQGRVTAIQCVSGTGALLLAGHFIARNLPGRSLYLPSPTWSNHVPLFDFVGLPIQRYRYFDQRILGLDFQGMLDDIACAPPGSVVLLQGCAHNPTGVDPSPQQWMELAQMCALKNHLPLFDMAYQGYASGDMEADAFAPRYFVDAGMEVLVAQSYSKNMTLYSERVGALLAVTANQEAASTVGSQLKYIACSSYLNPPSNGARIVVEVANDPQLAEEWSQELKQQVERIQNVRRQLRHHLEALAPRLDWSFVTTQQGMFLFTGLKPHQVQHIAQQHHLYFPLDGRVNIAGLPISRSQDMARAIVSALDMT